MPSMANITVKKADNTTDILWTAIVASGGDKSPAIWRSDTFGGNVGQRPELRIKSSPDGSGKGRRVEGSFTYPQLYTDTTTGLTNVWKRSNISFSGLTSLEMTDAALAEFAAQFGNLLASALVKSINSSGYSAA